MVENLLERLQDISLNTKEKFIDVLVESVIMPNEVLFFMEKKERRHYTKDDLVNRYLRDYFSEREVTLTSEDDGGLDLRTVYSGVNKEPLKAIGYGAANGKKIPVDIQKRLSGWENLYLLAGIWSEKYNKKNRKVEHYDHRTVVELVCDLIEDGINHMESVHRNVERVTESRKKDYITEPRLPFAKVIKGDVKKARQKVESKFHEYCFDLRKAIEKVDILLDEINKNPLFDDKKEEYKTQRDKIKQIVYKCMFPNEFLIKFNGVYGKNYDIKKHLDSK